MPRAMRNEAIGAHNPAAEDPERIDVLTDSSYSEQQSTGSQSLLTTAIINFRHINEASKGHVEFSQLDTDGSLRQRQNAKIPSVSDLDANSPLSELTTSNMMRRWSQQISRYAKEKYARSERFLYRLPSRKVFEVDGKLLSGTSVDPETEIEQLVEEIERHDYLMQDTEMGKQSRLDTLRALPQSLAIKRVLKDRLSITIEQHSASVLHHGWCKNWSNNCIRAFFKLWGWLHALWCSLEIWYSAMKKIKGHFGSNTVSFFKFLRWLFVLNLILLVCTLSFITVPQFLYNNSANDILQLNEHQLLNNFSEISSSHNSDWLIMDYLTGEGRLKSSLLFYGSYTNDSFSFKFSARTYSLSHAYFMTMLILYLFTFIIISMSMASSYRKSFIQTAGNMQCKYSEKIFCTWDYCISNRKMAKLKRFDMFTELRELLHEREHAKERLSMLWRIWVFFLKFLAHLLVASLIMGLGMIIWILLKSLKQFTESFFSWIAKMEDYRSPKRTLYINLLRNFVLELVLIGVLVYFWFTENQGECWENTIGQDIYRLLIVDLFMSLLVLPAFNIARVFLLTRFWPKCGRPDFDISQKSVCLVFNQTLLWIGLLFAPLLAVLVVAKMLLLFYANWLMLLYLYKTPCHTWRFAQTQTMYLVFTFLSLLGVIIVFVYIMTQIPVSMKCGPFRDYTFMFQIFIDGVLKLRHNSFIWWILTTLIRPAIIGLMLIIMAVIVYYLRAKSCARRAMVQILKDMLYQETKDKAFLLENVSKIASGRDGHLKTFERQVALADRYAESSRTWDFRRGKSTYKNV